MPSPPTPASSHRRIPSFRVALLGAVAACGPATPASTSSDDLARAGALADLWIAAPDAAGADLAGADLAGAAALPDHAQAVDLANDPSAAPRFALLDINPASPSYNQRVDNAAMLGRSYAVIFHESH